MRRRSFLEGILGACIAPAFVRPTSLMPLWLPATEIEVLPGDWTWGEPADEVVRRDMVRGIEQYLDDYDLIEKRFINHMGDEFIELLRPATFLTKFKLAGV